MWIAKIKGHVCQVPRSRQSVNPFWNTVLCSIKILEYECLLFTFCQQLLRSQKQAPSFQALKVHIFGQKWNTEGTINFFALKSIPTQIAKNNCV